MVSNIRRWVKTLIRYLSPRFMFVHIYETIGKRRLCLHIPFWFDLDRFEKEYVIPKDNWDTHTEALRQGMFERDIDMRAGHDPEKVNALITPVDSPSRYQKFKAPEEFMETDGSIRVVGPTGPMIDEQKWLTTTLAWVEKQAKWNKEDLRDVTDFDLTASQQIEFELRLKKLNQYLLRKLFMHGGSALLKNYIIYSMLRDENQGSRLGRLVWRWWKRKRFLRRFFTLEQFEFFEYAIEHTK